MVIDQQLVSEGDTVTARVYRNTDTTDPLEVGLTSSDPDEATPELTPVTIEAGSDFVEFAIESHVDGDADGPQTATITASADGFTDGWETLVVTDIDVPDLTVVNLAAPSSTLTGQSITVAFDVTNQGLTDATGTWLERIFLSDDPYVGGDTLIGQNWVPSRR